MQTECGPTLTFCPEKISLFLLHNRTVDEKWKLHYIPGFCTAMPGLLVAQFSHLWHVLVSNSFAFIAMFRLSGNNRNTPDKSLAGLQSFCCVGVSRLASEPGSAGISSQMG